MDAREQRGLVIAATCKLKKSDDGSWLVPSQTGAERIYRVNLEAKTCTCPDHCEGGFTCKHYFACSYTHQREYLPNGMMIETKSALLTERKVYKQCWSAYNRAQSTEKHRWQALLAELCRGVPELPVKAKGRKPHTARDMVFAMTYKVYSTFSGRRFSCDLKDAHERGYLSKQIPGLKIAKFMENTALTPILKELIAYSARPLRVIESDFAIDSSGFSSSKFERYYDHKWGAHRFRHAWVKCHLACGVKTNVVTAVRILDKDAADSPQFAPLVDETSRNLTISEMSADKAYASVENFEAVANCGGTGSLMFKGNATGAAGGLFEKLFHYFQFRKEEFLQHYHKRSNVESTFSAIKRKFGDSVRSRNDVAMVNEVLCKVLANNLCCLIQEQEELGIAPVFWNDVAPSDGQMILPMTRV